MYKVEVGGYYSFLLNFFNRVKVICDRKVDVSKILNKLPKDDQEALDSFFRCLYQDTFAYVLFGDKPMSISVFLKTEEPSSHICHIYDFVNHSMGKMSPSNLIKVKGWEIWNKYKHLFPSSNFILLENSDSAQTTIVMINKSEFLKAVEENIADFREIIGAEETPSTILDRCIKSQSIFQEVLKGHNRLFGILLGYGKHNSFLFEKREEILKLKENEKLSCFDEGDIADFNPLLMTLPMFMADQNHPETKQLKVKYKQEYRNIIKQYEQGDFLSVTLDRFCNGF